MCLGQLAPAVVGAYVPVDVEDAHGLFVGGKVTPGEILDQASRAALCGKLFCTPPKRPDLRARSRPNKRPKSSGSILVSPSALGSPSRQQNTIDKINEASP